MKAKRIQRRWIKQIAGYNIIVQSCWIDKDLDIIANVSIGDRGECIHERQLLISGDEIIYLSPPFKRIGRQMTFELFSEFLETNFQDILDLIKSLLTSAELTLLNAARLARE